MPLGARDVFIVLHARDEASRTIRQVGGAFGVMNSQAQAAQARTAAVGSALIGVGAGLAVIGGMGVRGMLDMARAAMEYNNQAALTLTQVQGTGTSLETIKRIGRDVALAVPAPFEEMQGALFDIFSSMDVNTSQAQTLLTGFSKAAVAGQTSIQTAGRATIAIMNAWDVPVSDLNHVLDVQFELVRSGVGTYEEFATSIGRAIPSARRAGQSYETLAGTMAFLTRNGLSAEMAATSSARAFETLANPKVIDRLADMGVAVLDSNGNFRQMNDVVTDLVNGPLADLSDAERARVMNEILMGAGNTAQARRFWDLAIRSADEYNDLVDRMINSSGALEDAYKIMLEDPQVMLQMLNNQWGVLKTELGDAIIPILVVAMMMLSKLLSFFNSLSPSTKAWIGRILLLGSVLTMLTGILTIVAGSFMVLSAAAGMMGTSLLALTGWFALLVVAIAGASYLIIKHWGTIQEWWQDFWPKFQDTAKRVWESMFVGWDAFWVEMKRVARMTWQWLQDVWDFLWPRIQAVAVKVWEELQEVWSKVWDGIKDKFDSFWQWLQGTAVWEWLRIKADPVLKWFENTFLPFWNETLWPAFQNIWGWLRDTAPQVWSAIKNAADVAYTWFKDTFIPWITNTLWPQMQEVWDWIRENGPVVWTRIQSAVQTLWEEYLRPFWEWIRDEFWPRLVEAFEDMKTRIAPILEGLGHLIMVLALIFYAALKVMEWAWKNFHDNIFSIAGTHWGLILVLVTGALQLLAGIFQVFTSLIEGDWEKFWEGLKNIAIGIGKAIVALLLLTTFLPLTVAFLVLKMVITYLWTEFWNILKDVASWVWTEIREGWTMFWRGIGSTFEYAKTTIQNGWRNFLTTLKNVWTWVSGEIAGLWQGWWARLQNVFTWITTGISNAWETFLNGLRSLVDAAKGPFETAIRLFTAPLGIFLALIASIYSLGYNLVQWLKSAFNFSLDLSGILGPLGALAALVGMIATGLDKVRGLLPGIRTSGVSGGVNLGGGDTAPRVGGVGGVGAFPSRIKASATGTNSLRGWTIAGEAGAELVRGGTGGITQIIPAALSSAMMRRGEMQGGSGGTVVLQIQGPIRDREDLVYRAGKEMDWHDFTRGR